MLPEVQRLAIDIESSDPTDPIQQQELHARLLALRGELERARAVDLAAYLDSAAEMIQYLVEMGRMGPDQVLAVASGLVRKVERTFDVGEPRPEPSGAFAPPAPLSEDVEALVGKIDLSLADDRMLGEVMLQLGFVTRKQLEHGLVTQRATDLRIGEALVATGAATWSQVKEAVAVQNRLRAALPVPRLAR